MSQVVAATEKSLPGQGKNTTVLFPVVSGTPLNREASGVALAAPEQITEAWLTAILRLQWPQMDAVTGITLEPISCSDFEVTVRLHLRYDGSTTDAVDTDLSQPPGPASLIAKFSRPLPSPRWQKFVRDSFLREVAAYRELNQHYACRVPGLVFAAEDDAHFNLLFEDAGGSVLVDEESLDEHLREHEVALQELAQLHGCFVRTSPVSAPQWQLRQRDSVRFTEHYYRQGVEALRAVYPGWLATGYFVLIEQFAERVADWHRFERHILTLSHGDVRLENLLFEGEGSSRRASLVSWKLAGLRNPMYDVASLLSNELSYAARNNSEAVLIQRYCRIFEQSGTQYPLREAYQDYRFNLFGPLIFNICVCGFLQSTLSENSDLMKRIRRNCQAIIDWDSMGLLNERKNVIA
ncbi:aminoglycoside phosphotransferase family protein [uncultured Microbulbifer sp.]|uniref:aminoglycoside phosphotransferase family protein n=1 Tax=uncultured Microbulbifer sp. TaxID=348147 RepID=UPI0025E02751|nr:aminoglycoside phosphotransferase family protein [uncultured Microbulbifer sp.]